MAEVYKAVKSGPDGFSKTVALKKILPFHSDQLHFIKMLSTEAKIHSYLSHPNIIQILDFFEEGGQYSMVLEYVDGKNLKEILTFCKQRNQPLPWQAGIYIMLEILKGLHYAHNAEGPNGPLHIIHRDVSPHNILISYNGDVKLSDFGIARAQIERDETASGVLKGKYRYLSPEQVLDEKIDSRSDIFSAGVTLYELLSLQHPFGEQQEYQTLQKIVDQPHIPLTKTLPHIKSEISHILDQALQKNPNDRFVSARDFYEDLLEIQDPSWITHGTELLSTLLGNVITSDDRNEEPIEKTSVLAKPIHIKKSLFDSSSKNPQRKTFGWIAFITVTPILLALFVFKQKPEKKLELTPSTSIEKDQPAKPPTSQPIKKITTKTKTNGKLLVTGPAGTLVYINGKIMGTLPLSEYSLPLGSYTILLDRGSQGQQIHTTTVIQKEITQIKWK